MADPLLTLQEKLYRDLRHKIMTGEFAPGRAITIRGLAQELGTSMMPVREALRRLISEQGLALLPNRRIAIPPMTAERYQELCAARMALEPMAATRALPYISNETIHQLHQLNELQDAAIARGDSQDYLRKNMEFHFMLYHAAPGGVLTPLIESLWLQIGPFLSLTRKQLGITYKIDRHDQALDAIQQRDATGLAQAIMDDIQDGMGSVPIAAFQPLQQVAS